MSGETALWQRSASALSDLLEAKAVSPTELLDLFLDRCASLNPLLNAIVTFDEVGARAAAEASERRLLAKGRLGPLDGLPLTIKDNLYVKGLRATWGSRLYAGFEPAVDDISVARLRNAGAVIVGKTNTPEFSLSAHTDNRIFGVTRNPWNTDLTPGGSSGGAVASVAAGMIPLALGTDAGGSIRRPASYAGVVGLRPSTGRVARISGFPSIAYDFQAIGPMARTVADTEMLYRCIAGPDPRDRLSLALPVPFSDPTGSQPVRILFIPEAGEAPVDPAIRASMKAAAEAFASLGHRVKEGPAPYDTGEMDEIFSILASVGLRRAVDPHEGWENEIDGALRPIAEKGAKVGATRYLQTLDRLTGLRSRFTRIMEDTDILLTPASATMPWPARERFPVEIDGRPVGPRAGAVFATFVNVVGHPAISLPAEPAPSGLPIGIQLVGRFGGESLLFRLARQYEAACPWSDRWPAICAEADGPFEGVSMKT